MSAVIYLKLYQHQGLYHYAKLLPDRVPPLCEVINFLNPVPILEHREYDLRSVTDRLAFKALFEVWDWIPEIEFAQAYKRATAGDFQIHINGEAI